MKDRQRYGISLKWKQWIIFPSKELCENCEINQGKIFPILAPLPPISPGHLYCRCHIELLRTITVGNATKKGIDGADWYLYYAKQLPDYYITKTEAEDLGYKRKLGNLDTVAPGKMIGGDEFMNAREQLPSAPGRTWYECDIDYAGGYRNACRILYSNDGLIFMTEDHYDTFIEIKE